MLSVAASALAAARQASIYTEFRPAGYDSLVPLGFGRGPRLSNYIVQLTHVRLASDMCEGLNDVIAVTSTAPIAGVIPPDHSN